MTTTTSHETYVRRRFDETASRFRSTVGKDDFRLDAVVAALPAGSPLVLDLGCGKGRFASRLQAVGARVIGLDASAAMLADTPSSLRRVLASAVRIPFATGTFDAVVAIEVFEHLSPMSWRRVVAEVGRVLRPGGRLILVDKNAASADPVRPWLPALAVKWLDERRGRWMYPAGSPVRERWFWPGQARRLLADGGLVNVAERPLVGPQESPTGFTPFGRRFFIAMGETLGGHG